MSEVADRMAEINEAEKKKELKEMRTTLETAGTMLNTPNIWIIGVPEKDKNKGHEKILEENSFQLLS